MKEEQVLLLDAWCVFEKTQEDARQLFEVDAMLTCRVKGKHMRSDEQGAELFDYHFPDEGGESAGNLKILEMAAKWKQKQESSSSEEEDSDEEDE